MSYNLDIAALVQSIAAEEKDEDQLAELARYEEAAPLLRLLMRENLTTQDIDFSSINIDTLERLMFEIASFDPEGYYEDEPPEDDTNMIGQIELVDTLVNHLLFIRPAKGVSIFDIVL